MDLKEVDWEGVESNRLVQDRDEWREFVNSAVNLQVP
jgi:hypothetical protein